jgi:anaphase-promoting complex subunit 3
MAPANSLVAIQLRQLIFYHLDNDFLDNALFFAGRLQGLEPRSPDTAHLMALVNMRLGYFNAAYDCTKDKVIRGQHLGCSFVFAQACLALERYIEGINALDRVRGYWGGRSHWSKWTLLVREAICEVNEKLY